MFIFLVIFVVTFSKDQYSTSRILSVHFLVQLVRSRLSMTRVGRPVCPGRPRCDSFAFALHWGFDPTGSLVDRLNNFYL